MSTKIGNMQHQPLFCAGQRAVTHQPPLLARSATYEERPGRTQQILDAMVIRRKKKKTRCLAWIVVPHYLNFGETRSSTTRSRGMGANYEKDVDLPLADNMHREKRENRQIIYFAQRPAFAALQRANVKKKWLCRHTHTNKRTLNSRGCAVYAPLPAWSSLFPAPRSKESLSVR